MIFLRVPDRGQLDQIFIKLFRDGQVVIEVTEARCLNVSENGISKPFLTTVERRKTYNRWETWQNMGTNGSFSIMRGKQLLSKYTVSAWVVSCPSWGDRCRQLWQIPSVLLLSGGGVVGMAVGAPRLPDPVVPLFAESVQAAELETTTTATTTEFVQRAPSRQAADLWAHTPPTPRVPDRADPSEFAWGRRLGSAVDVAPLPLADPPIAPVVGLASWHPRNPLNVAAPPDTDWAFAPPPQGVNPADLDQSLIHRPTYIYKRDTPAETGYAPLGTQAPAGVISRTAGVSDGTEPVSATTVLLDTSGFTGTDSDRLGAIAPLAASDQSPQLNGRSRVTPFQVAADPGNPSLPPTLPCANPDPELGCLLLDGVPQGKPPLLYLTPRIDFFRSNNLLLGIVPISDGLVRSSLSLLAVPPLDANTFVLAGIEGAVSRYFKVPLYNYDELKMRVGILRRLSPTMTAELGWINQQLFIANNEIPQFPYGTRFLNEHAAQLTLSRQDKLSDRLSLNSIYQLRWGFAQPNTLSRLFNVLFLSLNYEMNRQRTVQVGLDYQFSAANYTDIQRTDIYQQILGRLSMQVVRNTQFSLYGGLSFGSSTAPTVDFNGVVLGVSLAVNLGLF